MKYIYTAIFTPKEDGSGYLCRVPDLPGCISSGDTLEEAMDGIADAAGVWLCAAEEEGLDIAGPSPQGHIGRRPDELLSLVRVDTAAYRAKTGIFAVRKREGLSKSPQKDCPPQTPEQIPEEGRTIHIRCWYIRPVCTHPDLEERTIWDAEQKCSSHTHCAAYESSEAPYWFYGCKYVKDRCPTIDGEYERYEYSDADGLLLVRKGQEDQRIPSAMIEYLKVGEHVLVD